MIELPCACHLKHHFLKYDQKTEAYIQSIIDEHGYYKKVVRASTGVAYRVPVAWLLCHELREESIDSYGFELWKDTPSKT